VVEKFSCPASTQLIVLCAALYANLPSRRMSSKACAIKACAVKVCAVKVCAVKARSGGSGKVWRPAGGGSGYGGKQDLNAAIRSGGSGKVWR